MTTYQAAAKKFGTVIFSGREYILTDQADFTNRILPSGYTNYNAVQDGDKYDFELSANAIDKDNNEYMVYWLFSNTKGESAAELDSYDYDDVHHVVAS